MKRVLLSIRACAFILVVLYASLDSCSAQTTFQRTYGGRAIDEGCSVQQTTDGGYIVAGVFGTWFLSYSVSDVYLVKTDFAGDTLWTRIYHESGGHVGLDGVGFSVQQTSDGGYILAGFSGADILLIKTNPSGNAVWTKTYDGGHDEEIGYSVDQTSDGGYVIAGYTRHSTAGPSEMYLIKTTSAGDTLWTKRYGGSQFGYSEARAVQQTSDGGYILGGTVKLPYGNDEMCLLKINSSGDSLWMRTYGGPKNEKGYSVAQTLEGGYIIVGKSEAFSQANSEIYLVKTDAEGKVLWTRAYGGTLGDCGYAVQQTSDGGYVIVGERATRGSPYLVKANTLGDTLWTRSYRGYGGGRSVQQTADGGYIIAGQLQDDVVLIKTQPDGRVISSVEDDQSVLPTDFFLQQNYPNPFNPTTTIRYALPHRSSVALAVFNTLGQKVTELVNGEIEAGYHEVRFNAGNLASGVYFYRLQAGSHVDVKKLVLCR